MHPGPELKYIRRAQSYPEIAVGQVLSKIPQLTLLKLEMTLMATPSREHYVITAMNLLNEFIPLHLNLRFKSVLGVTLRLALTIKREAIRIPKFKIHLQQKVKEQINHRML